MPVKKDSHLSVTVFSSYFTFLSNAASMIC